MLYSVVSLNFAGHAYGWYGREKQTWFPKNPTNTPFAARAKPCIFSGGASLSALPNIVERLLNKKSSTK